MSAPSNLAFAASAKVNTRATSPQHEFYFSHISDIIYTFFNFMKQITPRPVVACVKGSPGTPKARFKLPCSIYIALNTIKSRYSRLAIEVCILHAVSGVLDISARNTDIFLMIVLLEAFQRRIFLAEEKHIVVSSGSYYLTVHLCSASRSDTYIDLETLPGCPAESFKYGWRL